MSDVIYTKYYYTTMADLLLILQGYLSSRTPVPGAPCPTYNSDSHMHTRGSYKPEAKRILSAIAF